MPKTTTTNKTTAEDDKMPETITYRILHEEIQQPGKFSFYFIWAILLVCFIITMRNISHILTVISLITGSLAVLYFGMVTILKLQTIITSEGITYRCRPFHHRARTIPLEEIENVKIGRLTLPFRYIGLKIKQNGRQSFYLFGGHDFLRVTTKDGYEITIGTRQSEELLKALKELNIIIEKLS
ncbi:MAG: hypothetical protein Q8928_11115 [Bacteroidota bacterium]|nr:hypothetical protein [Bacteroidota bacterium]